MKKPLLLLVIPTLLLSSCGFIIFDQESSETPSSSSTSEELSSYVDPFHLPVTHRHHFVDGECSSCKQRIFDLCNNNLGDEYFISYPNGDNILNFYHYMKNTFGSFYLDSNIVIDDYIPLNYGLYNISLDEANAVIQRIILDCPLYYFVGNSYMIDESHTTISLAMNKEYTSTSRRIEIQEEIDDFFNELEDKKRYENDYYRLLLAHDHLLDSVDYAYDKYGQASNENFAHTIVGMVEKEGSVCEGYAKSFQLICDFYDIPCVTDTGKAGFNEDHAWNAVNIDGYWYWVDVTWDDVPIKAVLPSVKGDNQEPSTDDWYKYFLSRGIPHIPSGSVIAPNKRFNYYIEPFTSFSYLDFYITNLYNTYVIDGITYKIIGYDKVAVTNIGLTGDVVIPSEVKIDEVSYDVVMIGSYYINKALFVLNDGITTLTIPSSVRYIVDTCLSSISDGEEVIVQNHVSSFIVDENNEYFTSSDGAIYTKDMETLVASPLGV